MTLSKSTYGIVLLSSLVWCLLILAGPVAYHVRASTVEDLIYGFFSPICHQLDGRSLHMFGAKFAVCARCSSIYFAFFFSVALYPLFWKVSRFTSLNKWMSDSPRVLFLSILPLVLDVVLSEAGVHESTLTTRLVTGTIFGLSLPFTLLPPADEALKELSSKLSQSIWRPIRHAE